jgi:uncharacterized phage infection (PIP) family protein YhgE
MADNDVLTEESILQLVNQLISIEAAARESADSQEIIDRQIADESLSQLISQEIDNRQKAISALQTAANQSITRIDGNVTQLQQLFNQRYDSITTLISNLNASFDEKVALFDSLRQIIFANQSNIATLQGDENTVGSVAKALFDAKAYTDAKVSQLLDGAPAILDTLKELATSIGNDGNFIQTINDSIQDAKNTAAANKQEMLSLLSHSLIKKQRIILNSQHIAQGYVELPHINIVPDSLDGHIDRLGLFEDEDFELSEVDGKTRLMFINNFAIGGEEEIEVGAELRVKYWIVPE